MSGRRFIKTTSLILKVFVGLVLFALFATIIFSVYWFLFAKPYLDFPRSSGSDLYNALTYASFFKKYSTCPPQGWMHLWNEGMPVVGGYPWLVFYLLKPLYYFFDTLNAVQVFSLLALGFFFFFSFILLFLVSGSLLLAFIFTLILLFTKASYFALYTSGFIAANVAQIFLPLSLLFLHLFGKTKNHQPRPASPAGRRQAEKYLVLAGLVIGFSFLIHPPTTALLIFPASLLSILTLSFGLKDKFSYLLFYLALSLSVGSMGLYSLFNQVVLGQGRAGCDHPYCWGAYPEHFAWLNLLAFLLPGLLFLIALFTKTFKRSLSLKQIIVFGLVLLVPVGFCLVAYWQKINSLSEAFYPRRTFWAISLLALLVGAASFRSFRKVMPKLSLLVLLALVLAFFGFWFLNPSTFSLRGEDLMEYPASYPLDAEKFVLPKYQKESFEDRIPDWLPYQEDDYRFDTFNQEINVWWNLVSEMPLTRGYSNHPLGRHRDWQYLLQAAVGFDQPEKTNFEIVRNRAYFLFDAYGIGFHEDSGSMRLHPELISDQRLVAKKEDVHGTYLAFSQEVVSPIVSPTNTPAVLFIGDEEGYEDFIRVSALANLNSQIMIPVKGPDNFDKVTEDELKHFKSLVLYRFKGKRWKKLSDFVKAGGNLFIESGSLPSVPKSELPEVFPVNQVQENKAIEPNWTRDDQTETLRTMKINQKLFSPLVFEGRSWTVVTTQEEEMRDWAQPLLLREEKVIMAQGRLGQGKVVWSGWNQLYHVVDKNNFEEAKLFGEIIEDFTSQENGLKPNFQVSRLRPEEIRIAAQGITGIYFKENYYSGWSASVDGKKVKLYRAGLDFMYFPVASSPTVADVLIRFRGNLLSWSLFILTILAVLLCLFYLFASRLSHQIAKKIDKHLKVGRRQLVHIWDRD